MGDSKKNPVVPVNCLFQGCYNPEYEKKIREGKDLCYQYNKLHPNDFDGQKEILLKLLGSMGKETIITPPFWCDYGYNIHVGDFFYSNHNLVITDGTEVRFGDLYLLLRIVVLRLRNILLIRNNGKRDWKSQNR